VEHPARNQFRTDGPAAAAAPMRSPLASKGTGKKREGEASLCAIRVSRSTARTVDQRGDSRRDSEESVAMGFRGEEVGAALINISTKGAKIRAEIEPVIGEPLDLAFPGGERIDGVVRWVREGCVGVEFRAPHAGPAAGATATAAAPRTPDDTTLEKDATDGADEEFLSHESSRSAKRARVLLAAKLETARGPVDARLRDLSCKGALLECRRPPAVGEEVVFSRGETVIPSRIAWTSSDRVGLEFKQPIEESEVLVHINRAPQAPQNHVQAMERQMANADHRRPNFSDRMTDYDRKLARVIGASLGVRLIDE
jgi:hypothetical protein